MSKETKPKVTESTQPSPQVEYYRLVKNNRNMFSVETIKVEGNKVVDLEQTVESYLPIAFDQLRRRTGKAFFDAVKENSK